MTRARPAPCDSCPYRCDVPSGLWHEDEYAKLRLYDAPTADQPWAGFRCHSTPDHYCHGWIVVHTSRGNEFDLLALRLHGLDGGVPEAAVPLFSSGTEAAEHGMRDIDNPDPVAIDKLARKIERRRA